LYLVYAEEFWHYMYVRQLSWAALCDVGQCVKIITQETLIGIEPTAQKPLVFKEGIPKDAQNW
jgi:hypothetical protein